MTSTIDEFERLIRRDPARRGLIAHEPRFGPLCPGHLQGAARELAGRAAHVGIATGFYVPHGDPPAAETDGPPGAALLAAALERLGVRTTLITDRFCAAAVQTAAEDCGWDRRDVAIIPPADGDSRRWVDAFLTGAGRTLTHLIAVERVGPSHTPETLRRNGSATATEAFLSLAPGESHDRCHNMRGVAIDEFAGPLHQLFDALPVLRPDVRTIGIGDGGNEIGMGAVAWEELHRRIAGGLGGKIACRIATDWTIVAGVSNWGAAALAASVAVLRERTCVLSDWDQQQQRAALEQLVERGPAVDGVTGRREATVDGLPFVTYIQPWAGIRRLLGLSE